VQGCGASGEVGVDTGDPIFAKIVPELARDREIRSLCRNKTGLENSESKREDIRRYLRHRESKQLRSHVSIKGVEQKKLDNENK
jgi:hypothetical protein